MANHSDEWWAAKKGYDTAVANVEAHPDSAGYRQDLEQAVDTFRTHGATDGDVSTGTSLLSNR